MKKIEKYLDKDLEKALDHLESKNFEEALLLLKKVSSISKNNPLKSIEITYGISQCLDELENYEEAKDQINENLKKIDKIQEKNKNARLQEIKLEILNNLGSIYSILGNKDDALNRLKEAIKLSRTVGNKQLLASSLANIGKIYLGFEGDFSKANKYFQEAEKICLENHLEDFMIDLYQLFEIYYHKYGNEVMAAIYSEKIRLYTPDYTRIPPSQKEEHLNSSRINSLKEELKQIEKKKNKKALCNTLFELFRHLELISSKEKTNSKTKLKCLNDQEIYVTRLLKICQDRVMKHKFLLLMGIIKRRLGKIDEAFEKYKESLKLSKEMDHIFCTIDSYKLLGEFYLLETPKRNLNESYRNYSEALKLYSVILDKIEKQDEKENFIKEFERLPTITSAITSILESNEFNTELYREDDIKTLFDLCKKGKNIPKLGNISKEFHESCKNLSEAMVDLKSNRLETDGRELYRRKKGYHIESSGKNWPLSDEQIDWMYEAKCFRSKSTSSIEIDIYGKRDVNHSRHYILGECTLF